jgi:hypothetical protein
MRRDGAHVFGLQALPLCSFQMTSFGFSLAFGHLDEFYVFPSSSFSFALK